MPKPFITVRPSNWTGPAHSTVVLPCHAELQSAFAPAAADDAVETTSQSYTDREARIGFHWFYNNEEEQERYVQQVGNLTVRDVTHDDEGFFTCVAANSGGTVYASAYVRVLGWYILALVLCERLCCSIAVVAVVVVVPLE